MPGDDVQFERFLRDVAARREVVNLGLEERLFKLVGMLGKIADPLSAANIPMRWSAGWPC